MSALQPMNLHDCAASGLNYKVELHVHIDGAMRGDTVLYFAKKRNIDIGGIDNIAALRAKTVFDKPLLHGLDEFLLAFNIFTKPICGSAEAIERVGFEFVEDCYNQGVIYVEGRYCPHILSDLYSHSVTKVGDKLTSDDVVELMNKGIKRAEQMYPSITTRTILCCIRQLPDIAHDVLRLCKKYSDAGVVGIDVAGNEFVEDKEIVQAFCEAKKLGIHRTAHAGENGTAEHVSQAIHTLHAERIGHGYHCLDDDKVYKEVLDGRFHLECCPVSSYITNSIDSSAPDVWKRHPIVRFAKDGANFSINADDPWPCDTCMNREYDTVLQKMQLPASVLIRANYNAARSSFLSEADKKVLLKRLNTAFGVAVNNATAANPGP